MEKEYCGLLDDGTRHAGIHLLLELWNSKHFNNIVKIREVLIKCVEVIGATLLSIDLHEFSGASGVSGVAILQESHISIHTWPEYGYAAMDIFVCGTLDPYKAVPVLKEGFEITEIQTQQIVRGVIDKPTG